MWRARSSKAERLAHNQLVPGSNPGGPTIQEGLMNYVSLFWELEQKSKITHKKEKRVKEIHEELKVQESVKQREEEVANLNSQLTAYLKRKSEIENEIFEDESRLKILLSEIEGNKFGTAREVKLAEKNRKDIQERLEGLNKTLKSVDEEIEERRKAIEKLENENSEAKKRIEKITKEYKKLESEISEEKSKIEKEFAEKTKVIPINILQKYLEIREYFQSGAIALVDHGFCGNCGVKIPSQILEELVESKGNVIIQCEICGKVLYVPE